MRVDRQQKTHCKNSGLYIVYGAEGGNSLMVNDYSKLLN